MNISDILTNPLLVQGAAITGIMFTEALVRPSRYSQKNDSLASKSAIISSWAFILAAVVFATFASTIYTISVADWSLVAAFSFIGFFSSRTRGWLATAGVAIIGCVILTTLVGQPLSSLTEVPYQILNFLGIIL